jgi:hypothetical protein
MSARSPSPNVNEPRRPSRRLGDRLAQLPWTGVEAHKLVVRGVLIDLVGLHDSVLADELPVKRDVHGLEGTIFDVATTCLSCCTARVRAATPP